MMFHYLMISRLSLPYQLRVLVRVVYVRKGSTLDHETVMDQVSIKSDQLY